ncbi:hypothetical protein [Rhodoferax sp.]|uniref:hypothetical protein n=1 Tax=Rhodoferax sp. TaxID=50421 RepID=UPI0025EE9DE6|nr:hypothetical protein [Rhodoferax sp.]
MSHNSSVHAPSTPQPCSTPTARPCQTLWVSRCELPFEELGTQPTRVDASVRDVLQILTA